MQILLKTPDKTTGKPSEKPADGLLEAGKAFYQKRQERCLLFVHLQVLITTGDEELPRVEREHHSMNLE